MSRLIALAGCALALALPAAAQRRPARPARAAASPASAAAFTFDTTLYNALEWREIGPFRGGRSTAVAGHAGQPYTFYFGATGGGVWKTTDGGLTWQPVSDKDFRTGSIGAIEVAPSDANVVYVGTGESPLRGNVSPGDGVYRSTDAGKTWTPVGLRDAGQIGAIRVHPADANLVYVAALGHAFGPNSERGVFRSRDGGKTWDKILFRSDSGGAIDLAMDPVNPRILYAAFWQARRGPWYLSSGGPGSGLFKSTDGGDTWKEITRNEGLPEGVIGKIGVTVSGGNHDRVWAIVEADEGGVFRSDDGGETWRRTNEERNLRQRAWYYTHIHADPRDAETVYVLNTGLYRSVDGGRTFTPIRAPHGDNHALWIAPNDPLRMINGNDGGANVTYNGGVTWTGQDNQPTAQFYHVITTTHVPYRVCGAQQDNSTVCIASRTDGGAITEKDWYEVGGCESGYIAARADEPDVTFAGCYGGFISRQDRRTGQERVVSVWPDNPMGWGAADLKYRFNWTFPIVHSPQNPNVLYATGNVVFKSGNDGQTWEAISGDLTRNDKTKQGPSGGPITKDNTSIEYYDVVFALAPSPHDSNTIWAGTDDGLVQVTRDGGKTWSNVTPRELPEWALISIIEVSPQDPATAYVAATRYKWDDFHPYIYKTSDYGRTWRKIVTGIPDNHFIRVVRADPARRGLLYAGGEFGVYVSFDDGANWQTLQRNLPVVPIHDLAVRDNDLIAATHGRSFWILDDLTPLHQLGDSVARAARFLFKPRDPSRMGAGGGGFGGGGGPSGVGRNPPGGAVVYFYLKDKPDSTADVRLEFLDARDSVIRRFTTRPREPGDTLKVRAGMNRFVWNLRYPDASRFPGMIFWAGGTQGPVAVPGTYKVRLATGDWSQARSFVVTKDPRVATTQEDYQRQFDLLIRVRDRVTAANDAVKRIRDVKEQMDGAAARARGLAGDTGRRIAQQADSIKARLSAIEAEIYQVKNRSSQDPLNYPIRLNNKLAALSGVVGSADAPPTDQSVRVFDELSAALQVQLDRLKAVLDADVPAFNKLVKDSDVPAVTVR
ncbi:MAG TPA: glycosyl hydrolase [Gemmatimonadales bacterium]|nr:glycosyl hydrolase [Gemmatimonadales bacterium]